MDLLILSICEIQVPGCSPAVCSFRVPSDPKALSLTRPFTPLSLFRGSIFWGMEVKPLWNLIQPRVMGILFQLYYGPSNSEKENI